MHEDMTTMTTGLEEDLPEMELDLCANCCQSLNENNKNDNNIIDYESISESLAAIYKLHYLTEMSDISPPYDQFNVMKLCPNCLDVFTSLQKFYEDFNQLRTLESFLSREIQELNDCIKAQVIIRNIKKEPQDYEVDVNTEENIYNSEGLSLDSSSSSLGPGPWVVIKRLEDDPITSNAIARCTKTRPTSKRRTLNKNITPNVKIAKVEVETDTTMNMDNDDHGDTEFMPPSPEFLSENEITSNDEQVVFPKSKRSTSKRATSSKSKVDSTNCVEEENSQYSKSSKVNKRKKEVKEIKKRGPRAKKYKSKKSKGEKESAVEKEEEMIQSINGRVLKLTGTPEERREERKTFDKIYKRKKTKFPNPCWYCDLDFPTQEECFNHTMQEHFETGHYICKLCSNLSTSKISFTYHQRFCKSLNPGKILIGYQCDKCDYSSPFKFYVDNHITAHHGEQQVMYCTHEGCPFKTLNPLSFRVHIRKQHPDQKETVEERTCTICDPPKVFKTKPSLQIHIHNMHTERGHKKYLTYKESRNERFREISKQKQANKTTICSECNIDLLTFLALALHRKEFHQNTQNLTHVCEKCGTFFAKSSALQRHLEFVHSNFRPFTCDICGKGFKSGSNLKDHISLHSEEGRRQFNARMRAKNARRKIRNQLLANLKTSQSQLTNSMQHDNINMTLMTTDNWTSSNTSIVTSHEAQNINNPVFNTNF